MSLYVKRFGKYYIHRFGKFWSGTGWTCVAQFGKPYQFDAGKAVIEKRFWRLSPVPILRRCEDFHRKPPAKPKKKDENDDSDGLSCRVCHEVGSTLVLVSTKLSQSWRFEVCLC